MQKAETPLERLQRKQRFDSFRVPCVERLRWLTRYLPLIRANLISGRVISLFQLDAKVSVKVVA